MADFWRQLFEQAQARGSKGTVISPLIWLVTALLAAVPANAAAGGPQWVIGVILGLVALVVVAILVAYAFYSRVDSDALRSEKFTLTKLAIEQSVKGDDVVGLVEIDATNTPATKMLPPSAEGGDNG